MDFNFKFYYLIALNLVPLTPTCWSEQTNVQNIQKKEEVRESGNIW
jgi:hypothetical protein